MHLGESYKDLLFCPLLRLHMCYQILKKGRDATFVSRGVYVLVVFNFFFEAVYYGKYISGLRIF